MKVNKGLIVSIVLILACRAINHFIWVEYAKPLLFSYEAEVIPEILVEEKGVVGNFRKSVNQFTRDYCSSFSYLPWVNCQDSHITKDGIKELWGLKDEFDLVLSFTQVAALGFLIYNQRAWISLDIFLFQMNGLFYGSFPSFFSTSLSLLQEILKNWVDFPMKDSLAVIRVWEPRVLPLLLLIPVWPQLRAYYKGQTPASSLFGSSLISTLNTALPLLGFAFYSLSLQFLETKKAGMAITAAVLFGYYYLIPKIDAKLQPYVRKLDSLPQGASTSSTSSAAKVTKDHPNPAPIVPNGSSGGATNGKKK